MSTVQTQAQADMLNKTGDFGPYHAANGHTMFAELRFPREYVGDERVEREYRVGDTIQYTTWNAWCAPTCYPCSMGESLPDW